MKGFIIIIQIYNIYGVVAAANNRHHRMDILRSLVNIFLWANILKL